MSESVMEAVDEWRGDGGHGGDRRGKRTVRREHDD